MLDRALYSVRTYIGRVNGRISNLSFPSVLIKEVLRGSHHDYGAVIEEKRLTIDEGRPENGKNRAVTACLVRPLSALMSNFCLFAA